MKKATIAALGLGLGIASSATAGSQLSLYNVITSGQFNTISDVEGKVVANSLGSSGATLAKNLTSSAATDINVAVQTAMGAGNNYTLQYGSVFAPADPDNSRFKFNQAGGMVKSTPAFDFKTVFDGITSESTTYKAYTATGTQSFANGLETLKVNSLDKNGTATFNLSPSDLNNANESLALNLNGLNPKSIIINVSGTSFSGNTADCWGQNVFQSIASKVLWNFADATSVAINSAWYGSVLAPKATLTTSGVVTGSIGVKSFSTQQEVHYAPWVGVPEASTYAAIGFVGLGALWTIARRGTVNRVPALIA